ncbi:ABC transporter substrate-binding protein [Paracoccus luteus]|uniref:ABC transporter substrate-binding protein n=1 Tax=Paracoccus luteus TaxID=2508543 RepID=UPI001070139A|nr:ABC transporter substrate-binding protein [Paracoccus luteus]
MTLFRRLAAAAALALTATAASAQAPVITVGTLENGTVSWELATIKARGLDAVNGFQLEMLPLAGNPATQVAMQGGEVDTIVSDLLWVAQQRAQGADFTFLPYSTAVGGVMVRADSPVRTLADLKGKRIGIAGGPVDKSWLILRAWSRQQGGEDIGAVTEQVFGAPPLIMAAAESGEVDAAINFWHFQAKMAAAGMREIVSVNDAARDLGLDPATPLLGYVLRDAWIAEKPALAQGLARASAEAKAVLATDDAAWDALRPIMNAADDAEFAALRDGWRAGIPQSQQVDAAAAQKMFAVMAELGGDELTGGLTELPAGLFWSGE